VKEAMNILYIRRKFWLRHFLHLAVRKVGINVADKYRKFGKNTFLQSFGTQLSSHRVSQPTAQHERYGMFGF